MKRYGLFGGLLLALCASALSARQGVVKTLNGQTYEGDIDEKDPIAVTVVSAGGISTRVDRSKISSITYADNVEGLSQQLAKLGPKDVAGRMALAKQAMTAQQYTVARDAVEQVLAIDPNNADAVAMESTIQSQLRLDRTKKPDDAQAATALPRPCRRIRKPSAPPKSTPSARPRCGLTTPESASASSTTCSAASSISSARITPETFIRSTRCSRPSRFSRAGHPR